ncbi:hypothetical protein HYQ46_013198 [Verticillium longisporum]|nr:hypothetical protein HYQ46_013198 [Verticillium longisporum]
MLCTRRYLVDELMRFHGRQPALLENASFWHMIYRRHINVIVKRQGMTLAGRDRILRIWLDILSRGYLTMGGYQGAYWADVQSQ